MVSPFRFLVMSFLLGEAASAQVSGISDASANPQIRQFADSGILAQNQTPPDNAGATAPGATQAQPTGTAENRVVYHPMSVAKKFGWHTHNTFGWVPLLITAAGAGLDQATNTPSEWQQGAEAFGDRFGNNFGQNFSYQYFTFALEASLHQDPRYFPSTDRRVSARIRSVVRQIFITHTDSGGEQFAFSRWGGALGSGLVANAWLPRSEGHWGDGFRRGGIRIASSAGFNLAQEFLPFFRRPRP